MGKDLRLIDLKGETSMGTTKPLCKTSTKLARIAQMSRENPGCEIKWLMPHYNQESLKGCFGELDGKKALGADQVSKDEYGVNIDNNISELSGRMKTMSYRPGPVREKLIPKEGKPGATRPLGISNFEDKMVQRMTSKILEAIYEPTFRNCSYGFRPNRSCHMAVKDLCNSIHKNQYEVVIDVDLKNYFGTLDHGKLLDFLKLRIKDETFLRYIVRMLKAGVLSDGELRVTDEGSPQGNVASPVLSNIYGHYVIDCWFEDVVKPHAVGPVELFRYCDDMVICCRYATDADRITKALEGRLAKFKLELNLDKTKSVPFSKRVFDRGRDQGTFDFLGFTFYLARTQKGNVTVKVKTSRKRFRSKLANVKDWVKSNRHIRLLWLWKTFRSKLLGHLNYYGVSHNDKDVSRFFYEAKKIFFKWINRRSQRMSLTWEKFDIFMARNPLPRVTVRHSLFS